MADIFLSYNEKDRPRVRQLAQVLERAGWSVWWDRRVPAGLTWRSLLEQELQNMRCMLVLWSTNSVKSEWVCEEATEGRLLGRLIPVFIERVRPPAGFREVQAADLADWDGFSDSVGLQQLLDDIAHKLGSPAVVTKDPGPSIFVDPPPPTAWPWWRWAGTAALLLLAAAGAYLGVQAVLRRDTTLAVVAPSATSTPSATVIAEPPATPPTITTNSKDTNTNTAAAPPAGVKATQPANIPPLAGATAPIQRAPPARCSAIHERQELGETPSAQDQLFLKKEC